MSKLIYPEYYCGTAVPMSGGTGWHNWGLVSCDAVVEYVDGQVRGGVNWRCGYCRQVNEFIHTCCKHCGAEQTEAK